MINKLRRKFILITMLSVFAVLFIIISTINIVNYSNVCVSSDRMIEMIVNDEGYFDKTDDKQKPDHKGEIPFFTRFFIVEYDSSKKVVNVDLSHIGSVSEKTAVEYANNVYNSQGNSFYGSYRYNIIKNNGNTKIVFLECTKDLEAFNTFFLISILISLGGYLVVFLLIFIFSKLAVKPFYENMIKQKQFITDASHELKTPLTIINADIEILEMDNGENEWTTSVKKQVSRMSSMTKKLTLLAKMDEEVRSIPNSAINLSKVLQEVIEDFSTVMISSKLHVLSNVEDDAVISGNEEMIKELFSILLENAYKYSSGDINISLAKTQKSVEVEFSNPTEIPDGNLDCLFDRFYRLDKARNSTTGGCGIGLSLARSIVESCNGRITAKGLNGIIIFSITFKI